MQAIASKTKEFEATCATLKNKHKLDYNDQLDLEKKAEAATSAQPKKKAKKVIDVENGEESEDAHAKPRDSDASKQEAWRDEFERARWIHRNIIEPDQLTVYQIKPAFFEAVASAVRRRGNM
jgi:hypothetical protein